MARPANYLDISPDEYLDLEAKSETRHEFVGGRIFAMTGATEAHNLICTNLTIVIGLRLRGSDCRLFSHDMKVKVDSSDSFYYPDLMVSCEPYSAKSVYKTAPCLILEVLSPSTADIDRREKLLAYQSLESVKQYAIVYQDRRRVELYSRGDSGWSAAVYEGQDKLVLFPSSSLELAISLDEIYEKVIGLS
jgi:Uma2 family endonuclease